MLRTRARRISKYKWADHYFFTEGKIPIVRFVRSSWNNKIHNSFIILSFSFVLSFNRQLWSQRLKIRSSNLCFKFDIISFVNCEVCAWSYYNKVNKLDCCFLAGCEVREDFFENYNIDSSCSIKAYGSFQLPSILTFHFGISSRFWVLYSSSICWNKKRGGMKCIYLISHYKMERYHQAQIKLLVYFSIIMVVYFSITIYSRMHIFWGAKMASQAVLCKTYMVYFSIIIHNFEGIWLKNLVFYLNYEKKALSLQYENEKPILEYWAADA